MLLVAHFDEQLKLTIFCHINFYEEKPSTQIWSALNAEVFHNVAFLVKNACLLATGHRSDKLKNASAQKITWLGIPHEAYLGAKSKKTSVQSHVFLAGALVPNLVALAWKVKITWRTNLELRRSLGPTHWSLLRSPKITYVNIRSDTYVHKGLSCFNQ